MWFFFFFKFKHLKFGFFSTFLFIIVIILFCLFVEQQYSDLFRSHESFSLYRYELPILRGRDSSSTDKQKEAGEEKLKELGNLVNTCIIRRTSDILSKY